MPLQQKTSKYQASLQNQSDRDGEPVEFGHGRELRFEERRPPMGSVAALRGFLDQALSDLAAGKAQESERLAKAVSALVRAERDVAEFEGEQLAATEKHDPDALRAELRRRLTLFAEAERAGRSNDELGRIAATGAAE